MGTVLNRLGFPATLDPAGKVSLPLAQQPCQLSQLSGTTPTGGETMAHRLPSKLIKVEVSS
jgi:hypothetical protein